MEPTLGADNAPEQTGDVAVSVIGGGKERCVAMVLVVLNRGTDAHVEEHSNGGDVIIEDGVVEGGADFVVVFVDGGVPDIEKFGEVFSLAGFEVGLEVLVEIHFVEFGDGRLNEVEKQSND